MASSHLQCQRDLTQPLHSSAISHC